MGLKVWIKKRFFSDDPEETEEAIDIEEYFSLAAELYVRKLAFQSAVNLIANSISKCEFKTYLDNKPVKKEEYYLLNFEPNKNQNKTQFIHKLINKLYANNECLVIESNGQLLIADTFDKSEYVLFDCQFTDVTVDNFKFDKTFYADDVLYFKLNSKDIKKLINDMYKSYGKLIAYGQKSYNNSRGDKGILQVNAIAQGKPNFKETFDTLMNERFKKFFEADNAVLPLFDGYTYKGLESKTYSNENSRDIKAMIDDVYDFTARVFVIPPALLRGDLANIENAVDNYLTFCIDPLAMLLEQEIVRKRTGFKGYSKGAYVKIDTKTIKHIDLLNISGPIDKLISSGAFCINDIRIAVGEEPIDEPWANQHFMTKNYETIEAQLKSLLQGGEE